MAEITAGMVKELREKTDAPMMECKKALTEAAGDMEKAEEILRVKLGNKANKAASRVTAEGVVGVFIAPDQKTGAIVEVNCETDFVAKNEDFIAFANKLAMVITQNSPADVEALAKVNLDGIAVDEARRALIGKIGENVTIRSFARIDAKGMLVSYVHGGARIATLVDIGGGDAALAKDIAMHIAAAKPVALLTSDVPADIVNKEREIARQKAAESGKPADIVAKMVEGSVAKFMKEVALMGQPFVKDDKQTVEQLLKSKGASVHAFKLFIVGQGIEKKVTDYAAEVAEAAAAAKATV